MPTFELNKNETKDAVFPIQQESDFNLCLWSVVQLSVRPSVLPCTHPFPCTWFHLCIRLLVCLFIDLFICFFQICAIKDNRLKMVLITLTTMPALCALWVSIRISTVLHSANSAQVGSQLLQRVLPLWPTVEVSFRGWRDKKDI